MTSDRFRDSGPGQPAVPRLARTAGWAENALRVAVRRHAARPVRRFSLTTGLALPRHAFRPPPRVDSAVLVIRRR